MTHLIHCMTSLAHQLILARAAARTLALLSTKEKNAALVALAKALVTNADTIEQANAKDLAIGQKKGLGEKLDRLAFGVARVKNAATDVAHVAKLTDPVGRVLEKRKARAGFELQRIAVPFGVIGMIYESRPNVTIDAAALALKSGNAVVLRGGSDALHTNRAIVKILKTALAKTRVPPDAIQFIDSTDRAVVTQILHARGKIDVIIPRGGKALIDAVVAEARVPIIETGASVVHLYVDQTADLTKAVDVIMDSKCRRVSICNALDTLLVHRTVAKKLFATLIPALSAKNVILRADDATRKYLPQSNSKFKIQNLKFNVEFLAYELNVKIVADLDEAIAHIQKYSLGHTEAILARDQKTIDRFIREIDAACVYANLSTQFSDGGEFGLGAEIGISTQKLHARGPFALDALTTYKWIGRGNGQIRG